jgi:hypothetical protein
VAFLFFAKSYATDNELRHEKIAFWQFSHILGAERRTSVWRRQRQARDIEEGSFVAALLRMTARGDRGRQRGDEKPAALP